jgi:hypothetical protein
MFIDPVFERDKSVFSGRDDFAVLMGGPGAIEKILEGSPHFSRFSAITIEKGEAFQRVQLPADHRRDDATAERASFQDIECAQGPGV